MMTFLHVHFLKRLSFDFEIRISSHLVNYFDAVFQLLDILLGYVHEEGKAFKFSLFWVADDGHHQ